MDSIREIPRYSSGFFRICLALSLTLLTSSLMNIVVFPQFDNVFAPSRDISVLVNAVFLVAIGFLAAFKPSKLKTSYALWGSLGLQLVGILTTLAALADPNPVALIVGSCATAIGRAGIGVMAGLAATRLSSTRDITICVALAFLFFLLVSGLCWVVPIVAGFLVFFLAPLVALYLIWPYAEGALDQALRGEAPIDVAITQPSSFLPFGSQLFVCLFLLRIAFGFSLRFGEEGGVPVPDFGAIILVGAVVLYVLYAKKNFSSDVLAHISVVLVVAGTILITADAREWTIAGVTLMSAGKDAFDLVSWVVLIAVAKRNVHSGLAALAWGRGVCGFGSVIGAFVGVQLNNLQTGDDGALVLVVSLLVSSLVGYALIGLRNFSFRDTIAGVEAPTPVVPVDADEAFHQRCMSIAQEYGLSPREQEVFEMLAHGRDRTYIQEQLVVSRNTVKAHVKHVYAKLDIHSHQDLIELAQPKQ